MHDPSISSSPPSRGVALQSRRLAFSAQKPSPLQRVLFAPSSAVRPPKASGTRLSGLRPSSTAPALLESNNIGNKVDLIYCDEEFDLATSGKFSSAVLQDETITHKGILGSGDGNIVKKTREPLGNITQLLMTNPDSKTFDLPQICRPSWHFPSPAAEISAAAASEIAVTPAAEGPGSSFEANKFIATPEEESSSPASEIVVSKNNESPPRVIPAVHPSTPANTHNKSPANTIARSSGDDGQWPRRTTQASSPSHYNVDNDIGSSDDDNTEYDEQDENVDPFGLSSSAVASTMPTTPETPRRKPKLSPAARKHKAYLKRIREREEEDKWNAESRRLMSLNLCGRLGRRFIRDSGRISLTRIRSNSEPTIIRDLGEEDDSLDFDIYVDEDCREEAESI